MEASFTFTPMESTLEVFLLSQCSFGRLVAPSQEIAQNHKMGGLSFYQNDEEDQFFSIKCHFGA